VRRGHKANVRWLPDDGVETPLRRASDITIKYSPYYRASCYGGIAGGDDLKNTLKSVRKALVAHDDAIEEEIKRFSSPSV
jgi:hypothetical protein